MPALHAVLNDIQKQGVDQIICLGDLANGGPFPAECIATVKSLGIPTLQGNHELYILNQVPDVDANDPSWGTVHWTRTQLDGELTAFIDALPLTYEMPEQEAVCYHASPLNQFRGFMPAHTDDEIATRMTDQDNITLFVGHTHCPLYRRWSNSWIINCGSVGMPLDGSPHAKYAIATYHEQRWQAEFRAVAYDIDSVMRAYDQSGLQRHGGIFAALFRYQVLTGNNLLTAYLSGLRQYAALQQIDTITAIDRYPAPAAIQQWLNHH
ncbi:MAG: metallophosphoesterase family protein [Ardenticatenales bacterium]|nr:metallophosphoesterase family protein [Ardenticatenales bacterium]